MEQKQETKKAPEKKKEIPTLKFTTDEINKLSITAKDRKYAVKNVEPLYPKNDMERIDFFINSYRFLSHLLNTMEDSDGIKKKISDYIGSVTDLYKNLITLRSKYQNSPSFNRHRMKDKMLDYANDNILLIDSLVDAVFPLGRTVKMFDPDEEAALA